MKIEYLQIGGEGDLIKNLLKLLIFGMAEFQKICNSQILKRI